MKTLQEKVKQNPKVTVTPKTKAMINYIKKDKSVNPELRDWILTSFDRIPMTDFRYNKDLLYIHYEDGMEHRLDFSRSNNGQGIKESVYLHGQKLETSVVKALVKEQGRRLKIGLLITSGFIAGMKLRGL